MKTRALPILATLGVALACSAPLHAQSFPTKPAQLTPEALGAHHEAEIEKWWPMIKAAGIKIR
jgi:hypothetical protein